MGIFKKFYDRKVEKNESVTMTPVFEPDVDLVNSQLSQVIDKVFGILDQVPISERSKMINKFIDDVKKRLEKEKLSKETNPLDDF
jgi:hypothetical protein